MSEILNIGGIFPTFHNGRYASSHSVPRCDPDPDAQGGVAVPRFSDALRRIVERTSLRQARVHAIQSEIETGIYETSERISGTVERLLTVIA